MSFLKKYVSFASIFLLAFSLSLGGCSMMPWSDDDLAFEEAFGDELDEGSTGTGKDSKPSVEDDFFADDVGFTEQKGQESDFFDDDKGDVSGFSSVDQATELNELKTDVETLEGQQEILISRIRELQEIIQNMEPRLAAAQDSLENALALNSEQSQGLEPQVTSLREEVDLLIEEINQLKQAQSTHEMARSTTSKKRRVSKGSTGTPPEYNRALAKYRSGDYEESLLMFQEYSLKNPPESLKDNVLFWIGSNYHKLGLYEDAIMQFQVVLDQYPDGNKVHDSRYLMGVSYQKNSETGKALDILDTALQANPPAEVRKKIESQLMELK